MDVAKIRKCSVSNKYFDGKIAKGTIFLTNPWENGLIVINRTYHKGGRGTVPLTCGKKWLFTGGLRTCLDFSVKDTCSGILRSD